MKAADLERARRLLRRPAAWLEGADGAYLLRLAPNRRGRIEARLDEAGFRALAADPGLALRPEGGWRMARAATPEPGRDRAGRPGVTPGLRAVIEPDGALVARPANLTPSAVRWLAARCGPDGRPWLDAAQVAAAERLELDAQTALTGPSLTLRWDALPRAGGGTAARVEPGDRALAASRRLAAALRACGAERGIVEAVVVRGDPLTAAETALGLKRRGGKLALIRGLTRLARHYGLTRD